MYLIFAVWCLRYRFCNERWFHKCRYFGSNLSCCCKAIKCWLDCWPCNSYCHWLSWEGLIQLMLACACKFQVFRSPLNHWIYFLQGWKSGVVTTLGRGGSDLTATTIGKALKLQEIQVSRLYNDHPLLLRLNWFLSVLVVVATFWYWLLPNAVIINLRLFFSNVATKKGNKPDLHI